MYFNLSGAGKYFYTALMAGGLLALAANSPSFANDENNCIGSDNDSALAACDRAIRRNPHNWRSLLSRGEIYLFRADYKRAIDDFTIAIKLAPKEFFPVHRRGLSYLRMGDYDRAIADYDRAIKLFPLTGFTFSQRVLAYAEKGQFDLAVRDFSEAIRIAPSEPFPWYRRGRLHFSTADYQAAASDFANSIKNMRELRLRPSPQTVAALYLARTRIGDQNARQELALNTATLDPYEWGTSIARMFLEEAKPDQVLGKAPKDEICSARFYIAHWHLLQNERERAIELLRLVDKGCTLGTYGHDASAELRRMGL